MNKQTIPGVSLFPIILLGLGLTACSSNPPTLGDQMLNQGTGTAELGKKWQSGSDKVQKGEEMIKDGKEMLEDGRKEMRKGEDNITKGRDLVEEGQKLIQESEREYYSRFPKAK